MPIRVLPLSLLALATAGCGRVTTASEPAPTRPAAEPAFQWAHTSRYTDASFAARAPLLALAGADGRTDLWDTRTWRRLRTLDPRPIDSPREGESWLIALSPDGKTLALATPRSVRLWDARTGVPGPALPDPAGAPDGLAWSPDGRTLAAAGGRTVLCDARTGKVVRTLPLSGALAFSADGRRLAVAGGSGDSAVYRVSDGEGLLLLRAREEIYGPAAFSPDGRLLVTGGDDPDWEPGPLPVDEGGHEYAPSEAYYAHLLKLHVWDARTGRRLRLLPGGGSTMSGASTLRFTPAGLLFSAGPFGWASLDNPRTGRHVRDWSGDGPGDLSPDGRLVVLGHSVYSAATGKRVKTLPAPPLPVGALAFAPDGRSLAAADRAGVRLWSLDGKPRVRYAWKGALLGTERPAVGFLPGGALYENAYNASDVWDPATGKRLSRRIGPSVIEDESGIATGRWQILAPDGRTTVNESRDSWHRNLEVRNPDGSLRATLPVEVAQIGGAVFSPDGRLLAAPVGLRRPGLRVWDLRTGATVCDLTNPGVEEPYMAAALLAFSPDGTSIAGSLASPIRMPENRPERANILVLWDAATGRIRAKISTTDPVTAFAFAPDGKALYTGEGLSARRRDAGTMAEEAGYPAGGFPVTALAVSPDGRTLAAGDEGGRTRLLDAAARTPRATLIGVPTPSGEGVTPDWIVLSPTGRWRSSPGAAHLVDDARPRGAR